MLTLLLEVYFSLALDGLFFKMAFFENTLLPHFLVYFLFTFLDVALPDDLSEFVEV